MSIETSSFNANSNIGCDDVSHKLFADSHHDHSQPGFIADTVDPAAGAGIAGAIYGAWASFENADHLGGIAMNAGAFGLGGALIGAGLGFGFYELTQH